MTGWGESAPGRRRCSPSVIDIKHTKKADLTQDDYGHMRKVIGYIRRHTAQGGPKDNVEHSAWRYSLMNWGHDPLKG